MDKLAIFGAGGHGEVSVNVAINAGWSDIVLFDDDYMNKKNINGLVLKGNFNDLVKDISLYNAVFVAIIELQPCAILANGPPCTKAGLFSNV